MALDDTKLVPQNPSAGPGTVTQYTYITLDDVTVANYFNASHLTLNVGDLIKVVKTVADVPTTIAEYAVTAIAAGVVTIDDLIA